MSLFASSSRRADGSEPDIVGGCRAGLPARRELAASGAGPPLTTGARCWAASGAGAKGPIDPGRAGGGTGGGGDAVGGEAAGGGGTAAVGGATGVRGGVGAGGPIR